MGRRRFSGSSPRRISPRIAAEHFDEIPSIPPEIVGKVKWVLENYRTHWKILLTSLAALCVVAAISLAELFHAISVPAELLSLFPSKGGIGRLVQALQVDFPKARAGLDRVGRAGFRKVEADVDSILKLDPKNGHGLYYRGEIIRVSNQVLFTPKSCVIAENLEASAPLDKYENDFLLYLDVEKSLPAEQTVDTYSAQDCYKYPAGYCEERTAWINHLLANDFYAMAMRVGADIKVDLLRRALKAAQEAQKYHDKDGNSGFVQCIPTKPLIDRIKKELSGG